MPDWAATERLAVVLLTPPWLDEAQAPELERLLRFAEVSDEEATFSLAWGRAFETTAAWGLL